MEEPTIDVAIVGAGVAGSYAAWRMRNAGMSVSLYEYSNRIGGRCHTVQFPGIPDVNVELGAMRFKPQLHPLLDKAITDLGLKIIDFHVGYGDKRDTLYYLRGKHLRYDELAEKAPYDLRPDHLVDPETLEWKLFKDNTDVDSSVPGYNTVPKKLFIKSQDGVPLYNQSRRSFYAKYVSSDTEQYLRDISGWDSTFVDVAAGTFIPKSDPALSNNFASHPFKTVQSGFQSVPETMVDQFLKASSRHSYHPNHHLRSLTKDKDGFYLLTFQPTQTVRGETKEDLKMPRKHIRAKKVLLAIPRVALEHLDWDVLKQPDIMDCIQMRVQETTWSVSLGHWYPGSHSVGMVRKGTSDRLLACRYLSSKSAQSRGVSRTYLARQNDTLVTLSMMEWWRQVEHFGDRLNILMKYSTHTNMEIVLIPNMYVLWRCCELVKLWMLDDLGFIRLEEISKCIRTRWILESVDNSVKEAKAGKLFFTYGDTWWRDLPLASPYAISTTPLRNTYEYAESPSTGKGILVIGHSSLNTEIWRDSQHQGNFVPGVGDDTMAMSNIGLDLARNMYAEIFNISVSEVQQPDYALMSMWDKYPFGAAWYSWRAGYIWEEVENKMTRPSTNDDVFIIGNIFSKTMRQGWVEGALEIVEGTLAKYFPDM